MVDIGLGHIPAGTSDLWLRQWEVDDLALRWPYPDARSDKYSRGVVGIDTGSDPYPGAAIMSVYGAVHGGAGMVRFLGADRPARGDRQPAAQRGVRARAGCRPTCSGPAGASGPTAPDVLQQALESGLPTVVDADGLRYLPERLPGHWLLTPHAGELATLLGEERAWVTDDPVRAVRAGGRPGPGRRCCSRAPPSWWPARAGTGSRSPCPGPGWTGQAGSGDVLGGMCAAVLAAGRPVARPPRCWPPRSRPTPPPGTPGRSRRPGWPSWPPAELGRLQQQDRRSVEERGPRRPGTVSAPPASTRRPLGAEIDLAAFRANLAALQAHWSVRPR